MSWSRVASQVGVELDWTGVEVGRVGVDWAWSGVELDRAGVESDLFGVSCIGVELHLGWCRVGLRWSRVVLGWSRVGLIGADLHFGLGSDWVGLESSYYGPCRV